MPVRTYHLPPNFTIHPPPKGPIHLGAIINNLKEVEVVNEDCRVQIPDDKITSFSRGGFTAKFSHMRQGKYGVWAKFLAMLGFGGEASYRRDSGEEFEFQCEGEDQLTFTPKPEYIRSSMKEQDVVDWLRLKNDPPVYLVTGLKIARRGTVRALLSEGRGIAVEFGVQHPGPMAMAVGPSITTSSDSKSVETVEKSEDFIVGIQVKRLSYQKTWLSAVKTETPEAKAWNHGASLLGEHDSEDEDIIIEVPDDAESTEYHAEIDDAHGSLTQWMVPNIQ